MWRIMLWIFTCGLKILLGVDGIWTSPLPLPCYLFPVLLDASCFLPFWHWNLTAGKEQLKGDSRSPKTSHWGRESHVESSVSPPWEARDGSEAREGSYLLATCLHVSPLKLNRSGGRLQVWLDPSFAERGGGEGEGHNFYWIFLSHYIYPSEIGKNQCFPGLTHCFSTHPFCLQGQLCDHVLFQVPGLHIRRKVGGRRVGGTFKTIPASLEGSSPAVEICSVLALCMLAWMSLPL